MSQFFVNSNGGSSLSDIETLTGNTGGPVGPDASYNINILGSNGVLVAGNAGTNTLTISVQNGQTDTGQTIGEVTSNISTIPLTTAGTYTIEARVAAWESTGPNGAGFSINGVLRSDGVTATLIDDSDGFTKTDTALNASDVNIIASGNNAVVQVLGVEGLTINWGVFSVYVFRGA